MNEKLEQIFKILHDDIRKEKVEISFNFGKAISVANAQEDMLYKIEHLLEKNES